MAIKEDIKNHKKRNLPHDNLTKKQREALKELSTREDMIITQADKGGATVIWGIEEYLKEANVQLNNEEFYHELPADPFEDHQNTIAHSLNDMVGRKLIDKETSDILKPRNAKPARFYLLPKIHKNNNPGRPVISSVNCHTTKLSKYVDHYIQPLAKEIKSYIRDTTDLLNKINYIKIIPQDAILVTMDVRSLYSNIKHNEGLSALGEYLNKRTTKNPPTEVITTLMQHILTLNNFNFNGRHFIQTKGCAMGTVAAPSYATIYMDKFENTYIYPEIENDCLFYARYIDDIFFIYTGGEAKLNNFLTNLNMMHDSIKFDHEKSTQAIAFLDILVYIDKNRQLQTTLHTKPTNTHNYLHYMSSHPKHLKNSLPYSLAIRLRRICTDNNALRLQSDKLRQQFLARGYSHTLIEDQINKAISIPRQETLKLKPKKKLNRIPLVTTFNNTLPPLAQIIKNRWDILKVNPNLKDIFQEPGIVTYRRPINLREI